MDAGVGVAGRDQGPPKQTPSPLKASSVGGQQIQTSRCGLREVVYVLSLVLVTITAFL